MSTILVTDAGRGSAVSAIRSLHAAGHRVIAADSSRLSAGRWSRRCDGSFGYPDPIADPVAAGEALARIVDRAAVDVVLPVTDAVIQCLQRVGAALPPSTIVAAAPAHQLEQVCRKDLTLALAERVGVPVPSTVTVASAAEARAAGDRLGWPVVVKPASSTVAAGAALRKLEVRYAEGPDELQRLVGDIANVCPALLQEYCGGEGCGVEVLAHEGRIVAAFQHRRLREVPITGGASSLRESMALDPELLAHTEVLIKELEWTGLAMVEFKLTPRGPRLMEINGRLWGSLPLAVRAGVDFPAYYVRMLLDGAPPGPARIDSYTVGVRSRNVRLELLWAASVLRGGVATNVGVAPPRWQGAAVGLGLLAPAAGYDILSWRDPLPGLVELASLITKFGKGRR
ncbi:MAG: ATP-grasp domain-containing protein [Acidimicrobiia bacterium]